MSVETETSPEQQHPKAADMRTSADFKRYYPASLLNQQRPKRTPVDTFSEAFAQAIKEDLLD